jgi:hypothetical protein
MEFVRRCNMEKFKEYIEKWLDGYKIKGLYVTPNDIYECVDIYNAIVQKEKPETINGNVKKVLDKCGIKTKVKGIGWQIV